jgi:Na+/melibiose symporter-like transporter
MLDYSAASVGAGVFYAFNNFILPLVLNAAGAPDLVTGLLSSTRSIEGAIVQPVVGAWSDRIWTRLGRRRPFMAVGIPISFVFFLLAPFVNGLLPLAVVIFLFSFFFNIAVDPYAALLPDIAAPAERGKLSGLSNGIQYLSQVAFLGLLAVLTALGVATGWFYVICGTVMLATFAVTIARVREPRGLAERAARTPLRVYFETLLANGMALRFLLTIFVFQLGLNAVIPFLTLYVTKELEQPDDVAFAISALVLLITAGSALGFGRATGRLGYPGVLAIGWALLAAAAFSGTLIHTLPELIAVAVLAGLGNGAASVVKWPLLTLLIPQEKTGIYAGLSAAADSVSIPLSVFIATELYIPTLGYRGIFASLAVNTVLALVILLVFVRVPRPDSVVSLSTLAR